MTSDPDEIHAEVGNVGMQIGDIVIARTLPHSRSLPESLPDGSTVKLVRFECEYYQVEWNGQRFRLSMTFRRVAGTNPSSSDSTYLKSLPSKRPTTSLQTHAVPNLTF
jgi:hypothetical protein